MRKIRTVTIQIFLSNKIDSRSNNLDKATSSSLSGSLFTSQIIILFFFLCLFLKLMSLACHLYKNIMAFVTFSWWYFFRQLSLGQNFGTVCVCVCACTCVCMYIHIYIYIYTYIHTYTYSFRKSNCFNLYAIFQKLLCDLRKKEMYETKTPIYVKRLTQKIRQKKKKDKTEETFTL